MQNSPVEIEMGFWKHFDQVPFGIKCVRIKRKGICYVFQEKRTFSSSISVLVFERAQNWSLLKNKTLKFRRKFQNFGELQDGPASRSSPFDSNQLSLNQTPKSFLPPQYNKACKIGNTSISKEMPRKYFAGTTVLSSCLCCTGVFVISVSFVIMFSSTRLSFGEPTSHAKTLCLSSGSNTNLSKKVAFPNEPGLFFQGLHAPLPTIFSEQALTTTQERKSQVWTLSLLLATKTNDEI